MFLPTFYYSLSFQKLPNHTLWSLTSWQGIRANRMFLGSVPIAFKRLTLGSPCRLHLCTAARSFPHRVCAESHRGLSSYRDHLDWRPPSESIISWASPCLCWNTVREIIPWGWASSTKKKERRKGRQIDFLFLEQESKQEDGHVGQTAAGWFLWACLQGFH